MAEGLSFTLQRRESEGTWYHTITCLNPDCGHQWEQEYPPLSKEQCPRCRTNWRQFAQRIKSTREEQGLSQTDLAAKAGLSVADLSKLERRPRRALDIPALVRIARALSVKLTN
jgi:ribosome-binding protein aMBF1 (putative translation factor)